MSDAEGAKNTIIGLNRVKKIGEDNGVTIVIELLNSKVDHHDYMCDHSAWCFEVLSGRQLAAREGSLYDIYHMQIMEGDLIRTIQKNIDMIGHFHTGGVPGRHELDGTQEVQWDGVMRGIAATNLQGIRRARVRAFDGSRSAHFAAASRRSLRRVALGEPRINAGLTAPHLQERCACGVERFHAITSSVK